MKCICFESLLSPCAWLVKWHNCKCVNDSVSDIIEKFSLFCNFSASHSITTPAVKFGLLLLLILKLWYYWTAELLNIVKNWINRLWKKSACSAVICQPGGREQKHEEQNVRSCDVEMFTIWHIGGFFPKWGMPCCLTGKCACDEILVCVCVCVCTRLFVN